MLYSLAILSSLAGTAELPAYRSGWPEVDRGVPIVAVTNPSDESPPRWLISDAVNSSGSAEHPSFPGDGSADASAGSPQFQALLNGYAARPPWKVAGVDYRVGVPEGTLLKPPSTIRSAGVSVNASSHIVTIKGDKVTLDGFDFSLDGGWQVDVQGSYATIQNSKFQVGKNGRTPIYIEQTAVDSKIQYNTIDGNRTSNGFFGLIQCNGIGTVTMQYNLISNAYAEGMVIGNITRSMPNYQIRYNLIMDVGQGFAAGAHGDWIQQYNAPGDVISDLQIIFNTFIQTEAPGGGGTQGLSLHSANVKQGPVLSETVANNTIVATGKKSVSYAIIVDTKNLNGTATVSHNYIVALGIAYGWYFVGAYNQGGNDGTYDGSVTLSNNINMITGFPYPSRDFSRKAAPARPTSNPASEAR